MQTTGTPLPSSDAVAFPVDPRVLSVGQIARRARPRWLGAPVDGAEHLAVAVFLWFLVFSLAAVALGALGQFAPLPLSVAALTAAGIAGALAFPLRVRSRGVVPALAVAATAVVALETTLPPAHAILGDRLASVAMTTGAALARHGGFAYGDPYITARLPEARRAVVSPDADIQPVLLPGFLAPEARAEIVPKFPLLLAVWTGVGVLLAGIPGGLAVAPLFGAGALALFFLLVRRASGGRVAALATLLLAFNGVHLWHSTMTMPETLLLGVLAGGLLAGLLTLREPRRLYALTAGLACGMLPLVSLEGAVVATAAAGTMLLSLLSRRSPATRVYGAAFAGAALCSLAYYLTTARLTVIGQLTAGPGYLAVAGAVLLVGAVAAARLWGKQRSPSEFSPPHAVLWAVVPVAVLVWLIVVALERRPLAPFEVVYGLWLGSYLSLWDTAVLAVGLLAVLSGGIPRVRRTEPAVVLGTLAVSSLLFLALYGEDVLAGGRGPLLMEATRRLLPTLIPLLAVLEAAALVRWLRALPGGRGPVLLAAALALTLARLPDVLPLIAHREHAGAVEQVAAVAASTEHDAVLFFDADAAGLGLAAAVRSLHGRTAYAVWEPEAADELAALRRAVQQDGRPAYYVGGAGNPPPAALGPGALPHSAHEIKLPELLALGGGRPASVATSGRAVVVFRLAP